MTARTRVRIVWVLVAAVVALALAMYELNPLRVPSADPRLRVLGFSFYRIPTHGMEPTIRYGKVVLASAWAYRNADPKPGDIIMFRDPLDAALLYAKRVIAAGGSSIEIANGVTIVDGRPIAEPYLGGVSGQHELSRNMPRVQVPAGSYFVMGDNRDDSYDSRMFGFIARSAVVARVE
ncbi:MAG TPA: signal peptidase I [Steroidobacteraceae bacterium]|nr:signal peptidase I [Steroidobacteraceae bacterium]